MKTSLDMSISQDNDRAATRRFADAIMHILSAYIPEDKRRDAWYILAETAFKEKFELTNFAMRKQYEAWMKVNIMALGTNPHDRT